MFSIVIPKLGFVTVNPGSDVHGVSSSTGFAELMLGPKFTFYRCESSKTVMAAGLNFDLPVGDSNAGAAAPDASSRSTRGNAAPTCASSVSSATCAGRTSAVRR